MALTEVKYNNEVTLSAYFYRVENKGVNTLIAAKIFSKQAKYIVAKNNNAPIRERGVVAAL